jgi:hypothetical protein
MQPNERDVFRDPRVGDVVKFDNGIVRAVVERDGNRLAWENEAVTGRQAAGWWTGMKAWRRACSKHNAMVIHRAS